MAFIQDHKSSIVIGGKTFLLDILTVTDTFGYSIAVHEYPYKSKNILENMGPNTQVLRVVTSWNANTQENPEGTAPTYLAHFDFLNAVNDENSIGDLLTFTHPKYGERQGVIGSIEMTHDDKDNYVEISFEFLVSNPKVLKSGIPLKADTGKAFVTNITNTLAKINSEYKLATSQPQWIAKANLCINLCKTFYRSATTPPQSILSTIYFGEDTTDELLYEITAACDRMIGAFNLTQSSPSQNINNFVAGVREMGIAMTAASIQPSFIIYMYVLGASRVAYETSVALEEDSVIADEQAKAEDDPAFDVWGRALNETEYETAMTIDELDAMCYNVKDLIDEAVKMDRSVFDLKDQAKKIQDYVNNIKLTRDRIYTATAPLQPLHLLVTTNGMSYKRAEQILKLNPHIHNPNFIQGDTRLLKRV